MAKHRKARTRRRSKPRLLPVRALSRLPIPPKAEQLERLSRTPGLAHFLFGSCPSTELRHVLACPKCSAELDQRLEDQAIREEIRLGRRRAEILAEQGQSTPKGRPPGLTNE